MVVVVEWGGGASIHRTPSIPRRCPLALSAVAVQLSLNVGILANTAWVLARSDLTKLADNNYTELLPENKPGTEVWRTIFTSLR